MLKFITAGLCFITSLAYSQQDNSQSLVSFTGAIGDRQGSISLDYFYNWHLLKSKKLEIGIGGRLTSYLGSSKYFSSAPASLANDEKFSDSLLLQSPQVNTINLAVNFGYRIVPKLGIGFNIDLTGISFGAKQDGFYFNGNQGQSTTAQPTFYNILLVGNNDKGSLNSEFYVRYFINEKFALKAAFQYLFVEFKTDTEVQQQPEPNDRFRNKAAMFSLGLTRQF